MTKMKLIFLLSAVFGVVAAVAAYLIFSFIIPEDALLLALFCGVGCYVLLAGYMLIHSAVVNKRYEKAEKNITSPVRCKANGNVLQFGEDGRTVNGNIYFCDETVIFAMLETRPYEVQEFYYDEIERFSYDDSHFLIVLKDGRVIYAMVPYASEIIDFLVEKDLFARVE